MHVQYNENSAFSERTQSEIAKYALQLQLEVLGVLARDAPADYLSDFQPIFNHGAYFLFFFFFLDCE
jgi:hypothetical protein